MRDYATLHRDLLTDLDVREDILTSDMSLAEANSLWLKKSFLKKFQDDLNVDCDSKALAIFQKSNATCREFQFQPADSFEATVIGEVQKIFYDSCYLFGPELRYGFSDIVAEGNVGPGASLGSESHNFFTKLFDSPLTATSEQLFHDYRIAISSHPTWTGAESARYARHGNGIVAGNRLSFVPKTSEVSRTICTEPVLNMFFQKGIGHVLERELWRRFKIDLSRQPDFNRRLARLGSIDGSYGTIDLSSASDSVSLKMLERVLPAYWLGWIKRARSPYVIYPDGTSEELHMVSSMGNGFTFPLETFLFSSIVVSCYRVMGIKPKIDAVSPLNFAVFGDDIIVRREAYDFVCRCLRLFGFTVNDGKSFNTGDFRESCGGDYWRGHNIRGVYVKSLRTSADVYSVINRIVRWSARTGVLLTRVMTRLVGWVKNLPIPPFESDSGGIKTPYVPASAKRDRNTGGVIYDVLVKTGLSFAVPEDPDNEKRYPKHFKRRGRNVFYNAEGLLVSFIGGYIRDGRISLRPERDRFKIRRRVTSSWRNVTAVEYASLENDWVVVFDLYFG